MLDSSLTSKQITNINAVAGTLVKTHEKSYFVRFHLKSPLAEKILKRNPAYDGEQVIVLQTMLVGDMQVITELVSKEEYNRPFN